MSLQNKCEITGSVIGSIEWEAEPNCKCDYCWNPIVAATTPPQPLQPGDKVLVEAEVLHVYTTDAEVEMTSSTMQIPLFSNRHLAINIPLSSIRPFPQEESNQDRQQTLEKR